MAGYKLLITASAAKELDDLPLKARRRMAASIARLALDPRPAGVEKLSGQEKYRFRQGDYRVLFSIDDAGRQVIIVKIGHRREVYR